MYKATSKLKDQFKYPEFKDAPTHYIEVDAVYRDKFDNLLTKDPTCLIGVEVEIEGLSKLPTVHYWQHVEDGSLRSRDGKYGREFIFATPFKGNRIGFALQELNRGIETYDFSDRCSVHVHLNVRELSYEQLKTFVLIYLSVERLLFNWVGNDRDKNLYCVPLLDCLLYKQLEFIKANSEWEWDKYCAMNLNPIKEYGSVEFRHMYGTLDVPLLMQWINMLQALRLYAINTPLEYAIKEISQLNTNSKYIEFVQTLFSEFPIAKQWNVDFAGMEEGVISVKEAIAGNKCRDLIHQNIVKTSLWFTKVHPIVKKQKRGLQFSKSQYGNVVSTSAVPPMPSQLYTQAQMNTLNQVSVTETETIPQGYHIETNEDGWMAVPQVLNWNNP